MGHDLLLGLSIFLACTVEMVEALTIVLAIGVARQWRSTLYGAATAFTVLVVLVATLGPLLTQLPIKFIWLIFGGLLTIFGLQWLRKASLRFGGYQPLHDEDAVYRKLRTEAKQVGAATQQVDWYAFTVAFKGVLVEGFEVVFIVLAVGASQGGLVVGVTAALAAFVIVGLAGLLVHRPLARVPENTMKFVVGLILVTFGTFFGAKGAGISWPGGETAILGILIFYIVVTLLLIAGLQRPSAVAVKEGAQ